MSKQLRVVVVDDSALFRTLIADAVNASGSARVVAHAGDSADALAKIDAYTPDLVTLDLQMPGPSGLETLAAIREKRPRPAVVVVSSLTQRGAQASIRALELGAHDVIAKPSGGDARENKEQLHVSLKRLIEGLLPAPAPPVPTIRPVARALDVPEVVGIGSSTGGPAALAAILPGLPASFPLPVLIVQHMPPVFTATMAESLAERCKVRVVEARHGDAIRKGTVYIAPGGRHMRVTADRRLELTDDPPENYCRPAVDYLFRSIAAVYRGNALGVILTGMGKDGTQGLRVMRQHPVYVIGQSEESCAVYGMPREARIAGLVDEELPAERIAAAIVARTAPGARACLRA